jgi:hypothetical protein
LINYFLFSLSSLINYFLFSIIKTMEQNEIIVYILLAIGLFLLLAPQDSPIQLPIEQSTKQIIACIALVLSYYFYNNQKIF